MYKFLGMTVVFGQLMTTPIISHANTHQTDNQIQKQVDGGIVYSTKSEGKIHFSAGPDRIEPNVIYKGGKRYVLLSSHVIRI
ncbi:TPA: hypothetical protein ACSPJ7_004681 [Bacillus cereus]